jgi:cytochrome c oxidase subunit II
MAGKRKRRTDRARPIATLISAALVLLSQAAAANTPMAYTRSAAVKNDSVVALLWGLIGISLFVVATVGVLLLIGIVRRWRMPHSDNPLEVPPMRSPQGLGWIYTGTALSLAALLGAAIWTFSVLAAVSSPPKGPLVTIRVTAHQWWWEIRYETNEPSRSFTTANEIHIPTGQPVKVQLGTADVIHSFWVPELTGKMETIPNQNNETWLEADNPGTYRGECSEYCGLQHAHMVLYVVAEPQDKFNAWRNHQLGDETPQTAQIGDGAAEFMMRCAVCHTIRGTPAGGRLGPDLTHLMTRQTIAAGTLPNNPGNLSGWIADPQHVKPGNYMPILDLSGKELTDIRNYLETLQ